MVPSSLDADPLLRSCKMLKCLQVKWGVFHRMTKWSDL